MTDFFTDKEVVETLIRDSTVVLKINLKDDIASSMHMSDYVREAYSDVLSNLYSYSEIIQTFMELMQQY